MLILHAQATAAELTIEAWLTQQARTTKPTDTTLPLAIFEHALDAILLADDNGRYVDANPAACKLLGYTRDELLSKSIIDITPPAVLDANTAAWPTFLAAGKMSGEYEVISQDGRIIAVAFAAVAHIKPSIHMSILRDISNRRTTEARLHTNEARLRSLLDTQSAFVVRTDVEGNYTYVNQAFYDKYSWMYESKESIIGQPSMASIIEADHPAAIRAVVDSMAQPGKPIQVTVRKPNRDGSNFWSLWEFIALQDADGQVYELQCIGFDITAIKAAEEMQVRYQHIFASTTDHISLVNSQYIFEILNEAYLADTGKQREDIIGHHVADIVGKQTFETLVKPNLDRCLAGETVRYDAWFDFAISGKKYMSVTYAPYRNANMQITGVIVNARDISYRKDVEDALRHSQQRYQGAIEAILDAFYMLESVRDDANEIVDFRIIEINDKAAEQLAMTRDELLDILICEKFPINRTNGYFDQYKAVVETGISFEQEYHHPVREPCARLVSSAGRQNW